MNQQAQVSGWERVAMGIERVRTRLLRVTRLLNAAAVPYAVLGGNAVAEWVGRVDEGAVRFTKDVDVLIRRADLSRVIVELEREGFIEAPDVDESELTVDSSFSVLALEALVRMKLVANRRKDQVHILDMLDVGLLDASWLDRVPLRSPKSQSPPSPPHKPRPSVYRSQPGTTSSNVPAVTSRIETLNLATSQVLFAPAAESAATIDLTTQD